MCRGEWGAKKSLPHPARKKHLTFIPYSKQFLSEKMGKKKATSNGVRLVSWNSKPVYLKETSKLNINPYATMSTST